MNSNEQEKEPNCPSVELLSEWHDEKEDPQIGEHVEICGDCGKVVTDYGTIDDAITAEVRCPETLALRISALCRELPEQPPMIIGWPQLLLRSAAIIVVLLAFWGL